MVLALLNRSTFHFLYREGAYIIIILFNMIKHMNIIKRLTFIRLIIKLT